jgi:uncharacterized membrane protein
LNIDFWNFISHYYINPLIYDTGYNPVDTITYAVILGLSLFGVHKLLNKLNVTVDDIFILAVSPYIFVGGSLRVVEDAGLVSAPWKYLLITPLIFFLVFFVCTAALVISIGITKLTSIKYYWPFGIIGIAWGIINVAVLYLNSATFNVMVLVVVFSIGLGLAVLVYFTAKRFNIKLFKNRVNIFILDSQLLDATATALGITFLPYAEKHVLPSFLIAETGTAFIMYPLKLLVIIPALYIIDRYLKGESENLIGLVKLAILTVGLAPAIRDIMRMTLGI